MALLCAFFLFAQAVAAEHSAEIDCEEVNCLICDICRADEVAVSGGNTSQNIQPLLPARTPAVQIPDRVPTGSPHIRSPPHVSL